MALLRARIQLSTPLAPEPEIPDYVKVPDYAHLLPEEIQPFTGRGVYDSDEKQFVIHQGGGHGGSHPHLVHEFVSALLDKREPYPMQLNRRTSPALAFCS